MIKTKIKSKKKGGAAGSEKSPGLAFVPLDPPLKGDL
jgi:hypothetical protein